MKKTIKFLYKGKSYSVEAERDGSTLNITRDGTSYSVTLLEEKQPARKAAPVASAPAPAVSRPATPSPAPAAPATAVPGALVAPMTGTIKELKVAKGDQVSSGQLVMVMEAMKMDIEVFSDRSGAVKDIFVAPGDNVREKQQLLQIG
ncbi:MAG: acetyl-CoA carboxylase biotin carboxyl carrier protein subunit [Spirochaetales bacterium]|nr:acetyl-CoA carboxylase biotin carboxyl carrier protein subunit [Spirochaetales bacterium]